MYRKRALLFAVSVILLAALFYSLDYNELARILSKLSLKWALALVVFQLFIMFLMALKWYVIVRRYAVSFRNVVYTALIGFMANSLTPMNHAGGEPVRAYVLSKIDNIKMEKAFATVLVDLYINVIPVLALNLLAIVYVFAYSLDMRLAVVLAAAGALTLALLGAAFSVLTRQGPSLSILTRILSVLERVSFLKVHVKSFEHRLEEWLGSFHRSIRTSMTQHWTLCVGFVLSSSVWVLSVLRMYLIILAIGAELEFGKVVIAYAVLISLSVLPILPGALGLWEWAGTGLFVFFGLPLEAAAAVTLMDRLLFYWLPIVTGFMSSVHVGLNVMNLMDR